MRSVCAATQLIRVQVSRKLDWYGWSWHVTKSKSSRSLKCAHSTGRCAGELVGDINAAKAEGGRSQGLDVFFSRSFVWSASMSCVTDLLGGSFVGACCEQTVGVVSSPIACGGSS